VILPFAFHSLSKTEYVLTEDKSIGRIHMQTDKETFPIGTRITKVMKRDLDKLLASNGHLNTADYVRDLIRKDFERRGLLEEART
jgi:hypothetical protein